VLNYLTKTIDNVAKYYIFVCYQIVNS